MESVPNSIIYRDLTPPSFIITRNNINVGSYIDLIANVTDNVAVDTVLVNITYPDSSNYAYNLNLSNGFYVLNNFTLSEPGEYLVNYTANDTTNNVNSTVDWFEVEQNYTWSNRLIDADMNPVSNVNVTLYRPNTLYEMLGNISDANGLLTLLVNRRFYDLHANIARDSFSIGDVNLTNITTSNTSLNLDEISGQLLSQIVPLYNPLVGIVTNSTGLVNNNISLFFNYSGYQFGTPIYLGVIECTDWNYSIQSDGTYGRCLGSWENLSSTLSINSQTVSANATGFDSAAFFLADNICEENSYGCSVRYGETVDNCPEDCVAPASGGSGSSGNSNGGGGGGGGGSSYSGLTQSDLDKIAALIKGSTKLNGAALDTSSIYKELFPGDESTVTIKMSNTQDKSITILITPEGDVAPFLSFATTSITLAPEEERDVLVTINVPADEVPNDYVGDIFLQSGHDNTTIPTDINVLQPQGKLLDVKIQPLENPVAPGSVLRLEADLLNLGQSKKVDVEFDLALVDANTGVVVTRSENAFAVETSTSRVMNITIPATTPVGNYLVEGTAYYASVEMSNQTATSIAQIRVDYPFYEQRIFYLPMWLWWLIVLVIALIVGAVYYARYLQSKNKRFTGKVEFNKLPQAGTNTAFVGKIAETGIRAFVDMNKLQMHTLIAGSTGGGKTVAAQALVEAALLKNKSVLVFDPTAQWTGFFRKCEDKTMLNRYSYFDMKTGEARSFNGSIRTIHDPYELIDIKKYMNRPGEITVFDISNLTPAQMDILVASTIEQIFNDHPDESPELKTLIVYDEVHRLLPKFGGAGQGFVQIERGAREFRKWGIGLILISQVLSDFVGEIKANIGTEIQMGTRYEGDLERVSVKYGDDMLKSVVKEPIGTGMIVNAEYNSGKPYMISFRPLLHSTRRLSRVDLDKYEKYFDQIEDIEDQIDQLKTAGVDIFDLTLELKLAREKVKEGQFQIADMYLESLLPNLTSYWKKLGKKPVVRAARQMITKQALNEGITKAKAEREKYIKENPQQQLSLEEGLAAINKIVKEKKGKKDTTGIEVKFNDFSSRVKSFNGKLSDKDKKDIQSEMDSIKKEAEKL